MARRTKSKRMKRREREHKNRQRADRRRERRRAESRAGWIERNTFTLDQLAARWRCSLEQARERVASLVEEGELVRIVDTDESVEELAA